MGMKVHGSDGIVVVCSQTSRFPGAVEMSSLTLFVGLDYHQAFVQVCVMNRAGKVLTNRRCDNSAEAIVRCVEAHGEEVAAAIEACCGAAALADELIACGWEVSLAHAGYVSKVKQSPDKTDWSDARLKTWPLRVGNGGPADGSRPRPTLLARIAAARMTVCGNPSYSRFSAWGC
jgi:hypothetical protein